MAVSGAFQEAATDLLRAVCGVTLQGYRREEKDNLSSMVACLSADFRLARFSPDTSSRHIVTELELLAMQHRTGVGCDMNAVSRLARKIGIQSKEDIKLEQNALERARHKSRLENNRMEENYLSQIMSFLKMMEDCLEFENLDSKSKSESEAVRGNSKKKVPSEYCCPLSLQIMVDPVIVASGKTFDRVFIEKWIEQGNQSCPVTKQRFSHTSLIPNYALKSSILSWCKSNGHVLPKSMKLPANAFLKAPGVVAIRSVSRPRVAIEKGTNLEVKGGDSSGNGSVQRSNLVQGSRRTRRRSVSFDPKLDESKAEGEEGKGREIPRLGFEADVDVCGREKDVMEEKREESGDSKNTEETEQRVEEASLSPAFLSPQLLNLEQGGRRESGGEGGTESREGFSFYTSSSCSEGSVSSSREHDFNAFNFGNFFSADSSTNSWESSSRSGTVSGLNPASEDSETGGQQRICSARLNLVPTSHFLHERRRPPLSLSPSFQSLSPQDSQSSVASMPCNLRSVSVSNTDSTSRRQSLVLPQKNGFCGFENSSGCESPVSTSASSPRSPGSRFMGSPMPSLYTRSDSQATGSPKGPLEKNSAFLSSSSSSLEDEGVSNDRKKDELENEVSAPEPPFVLHSSTTSDIVNTDNNSLVNMDEVKAVMDSLASGAKEDKKEAAKLIREMSKSSEEMRKCFKEEGAIKILIEMLTSSVASGFADVAVFAMLNLSIRDENKREIVERDGIAVLVRLLKIGREKCREGAVATLFSLSYLDGNKVAIGYNADSIPHIIDVLETGNRRAKQDSVALLYNLSLMKCNKLRIVQAGALKPLVYIARKGREIFGDRMVGKAVAVMSHVVAIPEGRHSLAANKAIPVLCSLLDEREGEEGMDEKVKEDAAATLLRMVASSPVYRLSVWNENVIASLILLAHTGTLRAKAKAKGLLMEFECFVDVGKNGSELEDDTEGGGTVIV